MKAFPFLLAAIAALFLHAPLHALTLPVFEDTSASASGHLTPNLGKVGTLGVAPNRPAFIRFDVAAYGDSVAPADVVRARLILFVSKVRTVGTLAVHAVTADWTEATPGKIPAPAFGEQPIAAIPQEEVIGKRFITVDVTSQVRTWLEAPQSDFGFAIVSDGVANITLTAKEGPGLGHLAQLEIDTAAGSGGDGLFPTASAENLRIVRGTVRHEGGVLTIIAGGGFSVGAIDSDTRDYPITFETPFAGTPTITITQETGGSGTINQRLLSVTSAGAQIRNGASLSLPFTNMHIIAVGPK
jgi:hypothetical protein